MTSSNSTNEFKWTDFAEELPPDGEIVLVWNKKYNGPRFGKRRKKLFYIGGSNCKIADQTHWARVPKPMETE